MTMKRDQLMTELVRRKVLEATTDVPHDEKVRTELIRRRLFPADSEKLGFTVPQAVTVEDLEAELASTPPGAERKWQEWELALAREHYRTTTLPFVRQTPKERRAS